MKKIISTILSLAIVISLCPHSLAFDVSHQKDMSVEHSTAFETALDIFSSSEEYVSNGTIADSGSYIDQTTGEEITVNLIASEHFPSISDSTTVTAICTEGTIDEVLMISFEENSLTSIYSDGTVKKELLTDIVTITPIEPTSEIGLSAWNSTSEILPSSSSVDYIDSEPFTFSSSGSQKAPSGATSYSGYYTLGKRGGYTYTPSLYGYLLRKNSGYSSYYAHKFTFSKGTVIGTAASVIIAYFTDGGILGITLSIATAMLGVVIDNIDVNWGVQFQVNRYRWDYKINLNSYTGQTIYTFYRTRDYWKAYNSSNGKATYENRGSSYYGGRTMGNSPTIEYAISKYVEDNL